MNTMNLTNQQKVDVICPINPALLVFRLFRDREHLTYPSSFSVQ